MTATFSERMVARAADAVGARTSRRGFLGRSALVGSALAVGGSGYVLRPGSAYAAVTRTRASDCPAGSLCGDGYTDFCCHVYPETGNDCPPGTLLAGWWKVDRSDFCFGTARYYMDCNKESPGCGCGATGVCQDDPAGCGCVDCDSRKDGCTVFRYGNCANDVPCVGPILCRVVTCTKPWEIEPSCSQVPRTDEQTRNHHRPCLERDPTHAELAFIRALYEDFLGRPSDATGEAYWGNVLVRGSHLDRSVHDVVAGSFAYAKEYVQVVIDDLYRLAYRRTAEKAAKAYWTEQLMGDAEPRDLLEALCESDEFLRRAGGTDRGYVTTVYQRILGRDPGAGELEYWVGRIADGMAYGKVAVEVHGSVESRRKRVELLYQRFLRRAPEPGGRDFWVDVLETREDIALSTFLAASQEYDDKAQVRFPEEADEPDPVIDLTPTSTSTTSTSTTTTTEPTP